MTFEFPFWWHFKDLDNAATSAKRHLICIYFLFKRPIRSCPFDIFQLRSRFRHFHTLLGIASIIDLDHLSEHKKVRIASGEPDRAGLGVLQQGIWSCQAEMKQKTAFEIDGYHQSDLVCCFVFFFEKGWMFSSTKDTVLSLCRCVAHRTSSLASNWTERYFTSEDNASCSFIQNARNEVESRPPFASTCSLCAELDSHGDHG